LVKDKDSDADKILQWLEEGAFDALRKQYLAMIVLGIYTNDQDPSKFVEAW
jgi:meiosis-specific protein HOP1